MGPTMLTDAVVHLACPPEHAWAAVTDFPSRAAWSERVKEASVEDGALLRIGSRVRIKVDRRSFVLSVEELDPPRRLGLLAKGPLFFARHTYDVGGEDGQATVELRAEYGGPLGAVMGKLMSGSIRRDLDDEFAAIRAEAEERAAR